MAANNQNKPERQSPQNQAAAGQKAQPKEVTSSDSAPAPVEVKPVPLEELPAHLATPVPFDYTTTDPGANRPSRDKFKQNSQSSLIPETKDSTGSYNPLTGPELRKIISRKAATRLFMALSPTERGFLSGDTYREEIIANTLGLQLGARFTQLSEELLSYPRAKVAVKIAFYLYEANFDLEFNLFVGLYPQEEGRFFQGIGRFLGVSDDVPGGAKEQKLVQKLIEFEFNTDDIPPDAMRVMYSLPVPIATKVPGSSQNGVSLIDVYKMASDKERELIVQEYGKEIE